MSATKYAWQFAWFWVGFLRRIEGCIRAEMENRRSDAGASLPPRKRLLAGLKQNGWFCSDSEKASENGKPEKANGETDSPGCISCGARGGPSLDSVKNGKRFVSVCKSCNCSLNSGGICCCCFRKISDDKGLSVAFSCCKCRHRVHSDCVPNDSGEDDVSSDSKCFVCVDCSPFKRLRDALNGGKVRFESGRELGFENCGKESGCMRQTELGLAASCNSDVKPCTFSVSAADIAVRSVDKTSGSSVHKLLGKQSLINSESGEACCSSQLQTVDGSREKRLLGNSGSGKNKPLLSGKSSLLSEALVAEAKAAAKRAVEALAVAKAEALRKAAEAVKAATAARDALNLAALAVQEERETRTVRQKMRSTKHATNKVSDRHSKIEALESKEEVTAVSCVVDDEELARELHRAINSSPRISRSLGGRVLGKPLDSNCSRARSQSPSLPKQHIRTRSPFYRETQKQEREFRKNSESLNPGRLAQQTEPGNQSACGKFGSSAIDKLLQTVEHSEAESSVGLLALNQYHSVGQPNVNTQAEMRDSSDGGMTSQVPSIDYDEKASEASLVLKELAVCNYSRAFVKDGNCMPLESEVGNLEKLAETVAVVMEEENSRYEEACIKEEVSCSTKLIELSSNRHNLDPGDATSQKQGGFKRKNASLNLLKSNECKTKLSKSGRTPVQAGNYQDNFAMETKCSPLTDESTMSSHVRQSNIRNNTERRTKSISGDFPQESQGSARAISTWHQNLLNPSQNSAGSVNLAPFQPSSPVPLQSPTFASRSSRKHS